MAHDALGTLGVLIALHREINLTTVAAILTIVGYSVNDTVIVGNQISDTRGPNATQRYAVYKTKGAGSVQLESNTIEGNAAGEGNAFCCGFRSFSRFPSSYSFSCR